MASKIAEHLDRALRTVGLAIVGVSIGNDANRATWTVSPVTLQAAAQPHINAFDPDDPSHEQADLGEQVRMAVDNERLMSAIVWCIIDTYSPPATVAKYQNARTKIINAYQTRPWRA